MNDALGLTSRRVFLGAVTMGMAAFTVRGALAEELARTPRLTEGPFYPRRLPLDTDNDLLIINDSITPAVGEVTHLTGRILSGSGEPIRNAVVEIWQCDAKQVYLAQESDEGDRNFQGFGRFMTSSTGEYYFRTIKPVPYPGRTPHIHFKIKKGERQLLTTQLFINGHPRNQSDFVYHGIRNTADRKRVLADFKPIRNSRAGELSAHFDIVVGVTPEDPDRDR